METILNGNPQSPNSNARLLSSASRAPPKMTPVSIPTTLLSPIHSSRTQSPPHLTPWRRPLQPAAQIQGWLSSLRRIPSKPGAENQNSLDNLQNLFLTPLASLIGIVPTFTTKDLAGPPRLHRHFCYPFNLACSNVPHNYYPVPISLLHWNT